MVLEVEVVVVEEDLHAKSFKKLTQKILESILLFKYSLKAFL